MIIHHWKLSLLKSGTRIILFTTTTDQMIESDLQAEAADSLIHVARQYHRRPQTDAQDHRDLAIGAFMIYAAEDPYDLKFEHVEETEAVPNRRPLKSVGGKEQGGLVPIWEDTTSDEEEEEIG